MLKSIIKRLEPFLRENKLAILLSVDVISMTASILLSVVLLEQNNWADIAAFIFHYWWIFPFIIAFRIGVFRNYGLYHWAWQYMSVKEVLSLIKAIVLSSMLVLMSLIILSQRDFPFSLLVIEAFLCFAAIGSTRLIIRLWKESQSRLHYEGEERRALIVGAGDAGETILREMQKNPQLKYVPVGFVDDNLSKRGVFIHHLPVLGSSQEIPEIVENNEIDEIIIAIPTASRKQIRKIVGYCEETKAKFKIVPGIYELIDGTVHVAQIRNVEIEDLLGRETITLDNKSISSYISDSVIMVTGAGGSIGSELCRKIAMFNPKELVCIGKGENSIFDIEAELTDKYPFLEIRPFIADIRDKARMENIFKRTKPDVIFHAAAHKHVYLMERDADEAVLNNIMGTKNMAELAKKYKAKEFVLISTDKAVNPSSVMGATKRIAEMTIKSLADSQSDTKFVSVRFGNVLGSRGSVVQIFKKQIAEGGPVTVTHPEATRYFMTIQEAAQLVIQAGAMGSGGETFILDMGEPVKILDLAKDLIRLSGLEMGIDIDIKFVGLKPGEKLYEELLTTEEGTKATKHEKIFVAPAAMIDRGRLDDIIDKLEKAAEEGHCEEIKALLKVTAK
ncbi:MAG: nucleoside-diphosphate sugar epimerase/dehydratase [Candidatus Saganbacteria bacterium]|nr:nucleoside-diphosphate sugar epimerase/dehydratase [Candidatus Saganbacteria bacterium]